MSKPTPSPALSLVGCEPAKSVICSARVESCARGFSAFCQKAILAFVFALIVGLPAVSAQVIPPGTSEWNFNNWNGSYVIEKVLGPSGAIMTAEGAAVRSNDAIIITGAAGGNLVPNLPNGSDHVLKMTGQGGADTGYKTLSGVDGPSALGHVTFTMIWDMYVPASNNSAYLAIYNGSPTNGNSADFRLTPNLGGVNNVTESGLTGSWTKGQWNRFAIAVDYYGQASPQGAFYVNGVSKGAVVPYDTVYDAGRPVPNFLLFTDSNPSNNSAAFIANYAFVPDLAMTSGDIAALGGASASGIFAAIPEPGTYAALFGVAALGFAAWRRRRQA
jgi:hypothetical protein